MPLLKYQNFNYFELMEEDNISLIIGMIKIFMFDKYPETSFYESRSKSN